ncbi:MAG: hypothetical protein QF664_11420 [Dehalococcoidia bacterium]|jgi:hypothetical protein|nr:hypothetical protein [Dehalococcoidia bacterium]
MLSIGNSARWARNGPGGLSREHGCPSDQMSLTLGQRPPRQRAANQQGGDVFAEARIVRRGRRVIVIRTSATGTDGEALADVTMTHIPRWGLPRGSGWLHRRR